MLLHPSPAVARQIKIAVPAEVHHRVPVAFGTVVHHQGAACQGVAHLGLEISGKSLLPVWGMQGEGDLLLPGLPVPKALVKAHRPAVEGVCPLIGG